MNSGDLASRDLPESHVASTARLLWTSWLQWVDRKLPGLVAREQVSPNAENALQLLLEYVQYFESLPNQDSIVWLKRVMDEVLGVNYREGVVGTDQGMFHLESVRELGGTWMQPTATVGASASRIWKRRTAAHELGHVVLFSLMSSHCVSDSFREQCRNLDIAEDFCETFAELLSIDDDPSDAAANTWDSVEAAMNESTLKMAVVVQEKTGFRVTFQHLYTLANQRKSSIRRTIAWLDGSSALAEAEVAITVFRVASHPNPSRTKAPGPVLRVWQTAVPSWGLVPYYRRAHSAGFKCATDAFDHVEDKKTWVSEEKVVVQENTEVLGIESKTRYRQQRIDTICAYIPIDVSGEGRYLIAIWRWPRWPPAAS